jgi:hypothetical protein
MPINIDFTGTSDSQFEPLKDGDGYTGTIVKCVQEPTGYDPSVQQITFTIKNITTPEGETLNESRQAWLNCRLDPKSLWMLKIVLRNLGYEIDEGPFDFEPTEVEGMEVTFNVRTDKWNQKEYPGTIAYDSVRPLSAINM